MDKKRLPPFKVGYSRLRLDCTERYIVNPNLAPSAKLAHVDTAAATANNGNIIVPP
jgi:hypothetical protein